MFLVELLKATWKPLLQMNKHQETAKIVIIYILFGFSWIYFSDIALGWLVHDPEIMTKVAIFKGLLFLTITSILLFFLIARLSDKIQQSTNALLESEERLRFLVMNSSDSLVILNADGSQRYVSPAAERITGFPIAELEGRALDTLIHPDDMKDIQAAWTETVAHPEKTVTVQYRHIHKTRGWVFSEAIAQSFLAEPAINGVIASVRDITEHKQAEEAINNSNTLLQTIINTAPMSIFFKDTQLRYMGCNKAFAMDAGLECPEDLIGKDDYQLVWKQQADLYRTDDLRVIESGVPKLSYDEPQTTPQGHLIWLRTSKVPLRDEADKIIGVLGMYEDITDRRLTEEALQEKSEELERYFSLSLDLLCIANAEGVFIRLNPEWEKVLGYSKNELEGHRFLDFVHPEDIDSTLRSIASLEKQEEVLNFENRYRRRDGTYCWIEWRSRLQGNLIYAAARDITERKRSEDTLRLRESYLSAIIENQPGLLWLKDTEGRFLSVNSEFSKSCGLNDPELLVGKTDKDIWSQELAAKYAADDAKVLKSGQPIIIEEPISDKGEIAWFETFKTPVFDNQGVVIGTTGYAHDITERKLSEYELRESEDKFSLTFNFSPDAVNINRLDDGLYVDINEGFTRITGFTREDVMGKTSLEIDIWQDPADQQRLVQGLQEKGIFQNIETQFRKKDGSLITALMSARVISLKGMPHIISITRDITERKKHEKEQLKIEKLESLGILAGGIAHDFNNILTGIMGNISFAKVFLETAHKSYKPLAEAEKAAVRAGELAHQLLTFARGGEPIKKVVSPRHLVHEALSFILHGSNVKGTIDIPDSIHAFEVDEGQISQVFQNIIINAAQAMPGGGTLIISAQNEVLTNNNTLSLPSGSYIRLTFTDQGCGISDENLKKIFDSYFTTKSAGIGLGLSSVHSIVSRHGGHIGVSSVVGKGTTFTIHLPSIGKVYTDYQADVVPQATGEHKGGSILVMDDDEMIRDIALSMLTHLGYQVSICAGGEEAVELYKMSVECGIPFRMAIMDLTISGGLGGREAAEQILSLFPKACLVVSSGYSNDPIMSNYRDYGFSGAIAKPYNIHKFEEVLSALLTH